jgi:hypothetical protein
MPTRPESPDPTGAASGTANPFAEMGNQLGAGLGFFQDWMKAAGSALPHMSGTTATPGAMPGAMPGWGAPTLDPAELDKRIQELKTVQFWLEQNARMVAMSIQGLEVQRMTLATLQGMNVSMDKLKDALKVKPDAMESFFKAAAARPTEAPHAAPEPAAASPRPTGFSWSPSPAPSANWSQGVPESAPDAQPPEPPAVSTSAPDGDGGSDDDAPKAEGAIGDEAPADLINPMRWWDTLTQQFSHLATQAAQSVQATPDAAVAMPDLMGGLSKAFMPSTKAGRKPGATGPAADPTQAPGKASAKSTAASAPSAPRRSARKPATGGPADTSRPASSRRKGSAG